MYIYYITYIRYIIFYILYYIVYIILYIYYIILCYVILYYIICLYIIYYVLYMIYIYILYTYCIYIHIIRYVSLLENCAPRDAQFAHPMWSRVKHNLSRLDLSCHHFLPIWVPCANCKSRCAREAAMQARSQGRLLT